MPMNIIIELFLGLELEPVAGAHLGILASILLAQHKQSLKNLKQMLATITNSRSAVATQPLVLAPDLPLLCMPCGLHLPLSWKAADSYSQKPGRGANSAKVVVRGKEKGGEVRGKVPSHHGPDPHSVGWIQLTGYMLPNPALHQVFLVTTAKFSSRQLEVSFAIDLTKTTRKMLSGPPRKNHLILRIKSFLHSLDH